MGETEKKVFVSSPSSERVKKAHNLMKAKVPINLRGHYFTVLYFTGFTLYVKSSTSRKVTLLYGFVRARHTVKPYGLTLIGTKYIYF